MRPCAAAAEALDEACWQRLERAPRCETLTGQKRQRFQADEKERIVRERGYVNLELNYEDVAEFSYQPGKCGQPYRVVALRKNISKMKGEHVLFDEIRYFLLHHDPHGSQRRGSGPVRQRALRPGEHHRAAQERRQRAAGPLYDLVSNWAYMVIAALAWNIKSWFALMMHRKSDRSEYIRMEFRRFIHSIILIPCRVMRRARTITLRLIGYQPTLDRFFSAWRTIERTGFG